MKVLITGANGQLGRELRRQLDEGGSALGPLPERLHHATVIPVDIEDGDLCDRHAAAAIMRRHGPEVVFHCAAYTNVDAAESDADRAFAVNAVAARNIAMACEEVGAKMVHLSTDYVFGGTGTRPYNETDLPAPASVYGATKLAGEQYVQAFCSRWFIVRTSWLYGRHGANFVKTILKLAGEKPELTVVNDQRGNPTNAEDLAHHLLALAPGKAYGLYHCTGGGICTWFDCATEIVRLAGLPAKVLPVSSTEYVRAAKRPENSALEHTMLRLSIGDNMRPWQKALAAYITELKETL